MFNKPCTIVWIDERDSEKNIRVGDKATVIELPACYGEDPREVVGIRLVREDADTCDCYHVWLSQIILDEHSLNNVRTLGGLCSSIQFTLQQVSSINNAHLEELKKEIEAIRSKLICGRCEYTKSRVDQAVALHDSNLKTINDVLEYRSVVRDE